MEVFGEGIFIELDENLIMEYLGSEFVTNEMIHLYKNVDRSSDLVKKIFLHTFSHLLMRAVSVESGYSLASLKERIYGEEGQFGILVYTSTPDSEGTLGGLSRLAKKERMESIIVNTLKYSSICSNDPLCHDGTLSEHEEANGSACHTCLLVPETSCEEFNRHLSRTLVEGLLDELDLS